MVKHNLIGSLVIVSSMVMMPPSVIADDNDTLKFAAALSNAQSVPVPIPALIERARVSANFDRSLSEVQVRFSVRDGDNVFAAHFHCALPGAAGPVALGLFPGGLIFDGERAVGTLTNADFSGANCVPGIGRPVNNIAALAFAMREGLIYINVHTTDTASGEVRGQLIEVGDDDDSDSDSDSDDD